MIKPDSKLWRDPTFSRAGRTVSDPDPYLVEGADMSYLVNRVDKLLGGHPNAREIRRAVAKLHNDVIALQGMLLDGEP